MDKLICYVGQSGSGKSLCETYSHETGIRKVVSLTTRDPRDNEKDGWDYTFINREAMINLIQGNHVIESEEFNGAIYATPKFYEKYPNQDVWCIVVCPDAIDKYIAFFGKDKVCSVYVEAPDSIRKDRICRRGDTKTLSRDESNIVAFREKADVIILNDSSLSELYLKVEDALSSLGVNRKCKV